MSILAKGMLQKVKAKPRSQINAKELIERTHEMQPPSKEELNWMKLAWFDLKMKDQKKTAPNHQLLQRIKEFVNPIIPEDLKKRSEKAYSTRLNLRMLAGGAKPEMPLVTITPRKISRANALLQEQIEKEDKEIQARSAKINELMKKEPISAIQELVEKSFELYFLRCITQNKLPNKEEAIDFISNIFNRNKNFEHLKKQGIDARAMISKFVRQTLNLRKMSK